MTAVTENRTKNNNVEIKTEGTFSSDEETQIKMSLSAEDIKPILEILTNLYSNPQLATLRELASNASDANSALRTETNGEDGHTPIEVTMPSNFEPTLVVKDYGIGMSMNDLKTVYSKYGKSLKQDDLEQLGNYGLGAKSPLTLSSQYSIISIKDGIKSVILVAAGEDNIGVLHPISVEETDEHSGTTVSVPISNASEFMQNAEGFFRTWKPGSVLVDEKEPDSIYTNNTISVDDGNVIVIPPSTTNIGYRRYERNKNKFIAVISGVSYIVDIDSAGISDRGSRGGYLNNNVYQEMAYSLPFSFIVNIPIGVVDLVPSRESLRYSDRTKKALVHYFNRTVDLIPEIIKQSMINAENRIEAVNARHTWTYSIRVLEKTDVIKDGNSLFMWRGEEIPEKIPAPHQVIAYDKDRARRYDMDHLRVVNSSYERTHYTDEHKRSFYTVIDPQHNNSGILSRMRQYLNLESDYLHNISICAFAETPTSKWITDNPNMPFVKWEDIVEGSRDRLRQMREARKNNNGETPAPAAARTTLTYPVFMLNEEGEVKRSLLGAKEMPKTVYYLDNIEPHRYHGSLAKSILSHLNKKDVGIVALERGRKVNAFLGRLNEDVTVKNATEVAKQVFDEKVNSLNPDQKHSLMSGVPLTYVSNRVELLDKICKMVIENKDDLEDRELVTIATRVVEGELSVKEYRTLHDMARYGHGTLRIKDILGVTDSRNDMGELFVHIGNNYPLANAMNGSYGRMEDKAIEHTIDYVKLVASGKL